MNIQFVVVFIATLLIYCNFSAVSLPVKKYDQRQDGDLNIEAHLEKIVLLIIPNKNVNFLDYSIKGQFENLDDLASLLAKEQPLNDVKYKQTGVEEIKDRDVAKDALIQAEKNKDTIRDKIEPKPQAFNLKQEQQKSDRKNIDAAKELVQNLAKKLEAEQVKMAANTAAADLTQKKSSVKSEGRTYQVVHSTSSGDKIVAVSVIQDPPEIPVKEGKSSPVAVEINANN